MLNITGFACQWQLQWQINDKSQEVFTITRSMHTWCGWLYEKFTQTFVASSLCMSPLCMERIIRTLSLRLNMNAMKETLMKRWKNPEWRYDCMLTSQKVKALNKINHPWKFKIARTGCNGLREANLESKTYWSAHVNHGTLKGKKCLRVWDCSQSQRQLCEHSMDSYCSFYHYNVELNNAHA